MINKSSSIGSTFDTRLSSSSAFSKKSLFVSRQIISDILAVIDCVSMIFCGVVARYLYLNIYKGADTAFFDYFSLILVVTIFFQFVARQNKLYDAAKIDSFSSQLFAGIYVCSVTFALAVMMLFFLKTSDLYSRIWMVEWALSFLLIFSLGRGITAAQVERLARSGALRRSVALIGAGAPFARVRALLEKDERQFSLTTTLNFSDENRAGDRERLQRFVESARAYDVDEVLIALPASRMSLLEMIVQQTQVLAADVHLLPDFGDAKLPLMRLRRAGDVVFITTISKPIEGWGALQKKVEDYTLAILGLVLALPAMALIALAIKLDSPGPVLFRQRRHGQNQRVIEVLKFRTMTVMEDGDEISQAKKSDKRVTRVGRFLRRTSLDELPQLINVLRGEMSIVGPRPHALAHNSYYGNLVENYANRHRVKPGITGWAQVHGYRGETNHPHKMAERVRYDLEYIDNWSIWLDLKIIIMTPLFGLFRGAY
jgi:putative colanic acid biosynthesis UDP-glucose lipid carrier transferase